MSYDFHGSWDSQTGHNSALYNNNDATSSEFNTDSAVTNLMTAGVPKEKIVPGLAFYGRSFANVAGAGTNQSFSGTGSSSYDDVGMLTYADIANNYVNKNGYQYFWDDIAKVPYLYNATKKEFISYDDPTSIQNKARYALDKGLGGVMFWSLSDDNGELVTAINSGFNTDPSGDPNIGDNSTDSSSGDTTSGNDNPINNVERVKIIVDAAKWADLFPLANSIYSYTEFLKAVEQFPKLCGGDELTCRKELATIFAHMTQETGYHSASNRVPEWQQGLYYVREIACDGAGGTGCGDYRTSCPAGTWVSYAYPCFDGQNYYGRGAKQLSYNYNYGLFSRAIFNDATVLLKNPDRVAQEGWLAVSSAIWFYMTSQSPKPSMHDIVTGKWQANAQDTAANIQAGFGATTHVINGGIECGSGSESQQSQKRIEYYQAFSQAFGIDSSENLTCANMQAFPDEGAGAQKSYWDVSSNGEQSCQLVSWQTPFLTLYSEDYQRCVDYHLGSTPAACGDGQDNDGDGFIDLLDAGCSDIHDTDETNTTDDNTGDTGNTEDGNGTDSSTIPAWDGNAVVYQLDDLITYKGNIYKVILAHTSVSNWYPDAVWYFENQGSIGDSSGNDTGTDVNDGSTTDTNDGSTTDTNDSGTTDTNTIPAWSGASVSYALDDLVTFKGDIYKVILAHTSVSNWYPDAVWYFENQGSAGDGTDTSDNSPDTGAIPEWNGAGVSYALNDLVRYKNETYKIILAHTSVANWYPDAVWYFEKQ